VNGGEVVSGEWRERPTSSVASIKAFTDISRSVTSPSWRGAGDRIEAQRLWQMVRDACPAMPRPWRGAKLRSKPAASDAAASLRAIFNRRLQPRQDKQTALPMRKLQRDGSRHRETCCRSPSRAKCCLISQADEWPRTRIVSITAPTEIASLNPRALFFRSEACRRLDNLYKMEPLAL